MITQGQKPPDKSRHIIPKRSITPDRFSSVPSVCGELGICLSKCHSAMNINVRRCQRDELWGRLKAALSRVYLPHVMNSRGSDTNRAASESRQQRARQSALLEWLFNAFNSRFSFFLWEVNNVWEENMYAFDYILWRYLLSFTSMSLHTWWISQLGACFGPCEKYMQYMHTLWQGYSNVGDGICNFLFYLIIIFSLRIKMFLL